MIRKHILMSIFVVLTTAGLAHALPLTILSPADGAVLPANMEYLEVIWEEANSGSWLLSVANGETRKVLTSDTTRLTLEKAQLEAFDRRQPLTLQVCEQQNPAKCSSPATVTFIDEPLTGTVQFRVVEPLFNPAQLSEVLRIDLQTGNRDSLYSSDKVCIGCHAYSSDGKIAINVKRNKDRRLVIFESGAEGPKLVTSRKLSEFAFLSWSPAGDKLAMVANSFGVIDIRPQPASPFDLVYHSGDLAILDMASGQVKPLPGASELHYVEDMPVWSPDGKELLFVRYRVDKGEPVKEMDIYRIPFNDGNGGKVTPLLPPAGPTKFRFLPTYTPDGRWISYVQGDGSGGVFARESSDIWLVPADGGEPRRLEMNVEGVMDSWHQWSQNGSWLLFAAKRGDNETKLLASYFDAAGKAYPPFAVAMVQNCKVNIPQYQAVNTTAPVSLPEFNRLIDLVYGNRTTE